MSFRALNIIGVDIAGGRLVRKFVKAVAPQHVARGQSL